MRKPGKRKFVPLDPSAPVRFTLRPSFAATPSPGKPPPSVAAARIQRRAAGRLVAAHEFLDVALPENDGDVCYLLLTGFFDPCDLLFAFLERQDVPCRRLRLATLSVSTVRNLPRLVEMLATWPGLSIDLMLSSYSCNMDPGTLTTCQTALPPPRCRVVTSTSHCKFSLAELSDGRKYLFHGSANLRSCRSYEQMTFSRDATGHDFYALWFDEEVGKRAKKEG